MVGLYSKKLISIDSRSIAYFRLIIYL